MSHQTDYYSNSQVVLLTSAFKNCRTLTKPDELEQFKPMIYSNTEFKYLFMIFFLKINN